MSTIQNTIAINDRMSVVFSSITKAMHSTLGAMKSVNSSTENTSRIFDKASNDIKNAEKNLALYSKELKQIENNSQRATNSSGSFFKGLMGASAVQKVLGLVNNQIGSAISRMDTINNYPKVMSNLGINESESKASINRLQEGLKGIPTTLDDAVAAVQRFTSANKSIGYSTEAFLALNNAILAGGGNTQVQSSALEQLSQAYSKGKMDMMEWRSLQTAMPAQLDQVATAMNMTTTKLGEGLRNGKIPMDDFMQTLIKLNKEGVNGLPSFAKQAENATKGFGTAIANMKSAVTRGITQMIENINNALSNAGLPNIQTMIANVGSSIENMLQNIGTNIGNMITFLSPAFQLIQQIGNFITNNWSIIAPIIMGIVGAIALYNFALKANNTIKGISATIDGIKTFASSVYCAALEMQTGATFKATAAQYGFNAALFACPLTWILIAIIAIIAVIYAVVAAINKVTGSTYSATGVIMGVIFTAGAFIGNVFLGLLDLVLTVINALVNPWIAFANFLANLFNDPIASIIHLFGDLADSILGILEGIAKALDKVFGFNLASSVQGWRSKLGGIVEEAANKYGNGSYEKVAETLNLSSDSLDLKRIKYTDAWNSGYNKGANLFGGKNKENEALETVKNNSSILKKNATDTTGTDQKGGKALKTTTDDDLISDEDIKLLLDVATRDYKLNYQQITPQVTVSFGDVRETADVDKVLDKVADKLEEIYDSDLEVV